MTRLIRWDFWGRFCEYEVFCDGERLCTAHLHEHRVLNCTKKNMKDAKSGRRPCRDARPPEREQ